MKNCFNCGVLLFENARFCHDCGSRTLIEEIDCIHCQTPNLMGAKFCVECGNSLYEKKSPPVEEPVSSVEEDNADLVLEDLDDLLYADSKKNSNVSEEESSAIDEAETAFTNVIEINDLRSDPDSGKSEKKKTARSSKSEWRESPDTFENAAEIWQLKQIFFDSLKKRVEEEHPPAKYTEYIDRLETSGFNNILDINVRNIYRKIEQMRKANEPDFKPETYRFVAFENLLDTFLIRYCKDLNPIPLPEKILKYQDFEPDEERLFEMVLDYLDLESEPEPVYLDFIKMPLKKLQTANKRYLKTEKNEKIFFICDQSIAGSCREGFAMTDRAIYWRAHLLPPQKIEYRHLISIVREQDWILLNEQFFNVNPSLNLKVMKVLKKLQRSV